MGLWHDPNFLQDLEMLQNEFPNVKCFCGWPVKTYRSFSLSISWNAERSVSRTGIVNEIS